MEKQFIQIQLSLFFKLGYEGPFEKASLIIKEQLGNDLNAQIIGVPNNAPSEFPRVVINSPLMNINLSKNRIDFFSKNNTFVQDNFEKIFTILNNLAMEIGRVGVVITSFKEITLENFKLIFDQKTISGLNPKEITIRFNEQESMNSFEINNSQMYLTGLMKNNEGITRKGIIITRDINTRAEDLNINKFEKDNLRNFIFSALSKAEAAIF